MYPYGKVCLELIQHYIMFSRYIIYYDLLFFMHFKHYSELNKQQLNNFGKKISMLLREKVRQLPTKV